MAQNPTLRHRLEYALFRFLEGGLRLVPWSMALALGRTCGLLAYYLDARHRRIARENLRASDLVLSEAEVNRIIRTCFAHFGSVLFTTVHLLHMTAEEAASRVRLEGMEHWDRLRERKQGFITLTGHYGNWELMALGFAAAGYPLTAIGRELDNPLLGPRLFALRSRFGNAMVSKSGAYRDSIRILKAGGAVGFLLDQDALTRGVFVSFMGRWASTHASAAALMVKYQVPVLPMISWPNPDGTLTVRVEAPWMAPSTGNPERDIWTTTQLLTRTLETWVKRDPRWWFWLHRRFKTRPGEGDPLPAPLPPDEWLASIPSAEPWV